MRALGLEAGGLWLSYGLPDANRDRFGRSGGGGALRFPSPVVDTREIFRHCWAMLTEDMPPGALPNYVGMTLFHLQPQTNQLELWPRGKRDQPALANALDHLNDKFGDFTVTRGSFWGLDDRDAPDRIGFRKTVGVDANDLVIQR